MLVSVLVPIYNASRFLRQCVDSILSQTYTDFEVLLSNDCSTDNSLDICREYESKDSRVRIIDNKRNVGLYNNRFYALELVKGDFLLQVDADDWIKPDCISSMVEDAEKYGVDVVTTGLIRTMDRWGIFSQKQNNYKPGLFTEKQLEQYHHIFSQRVFSNNICSKLIKMDVIRKSMDRLYPMNIHYGDDLLFIQNISPNIHSVYVQSDCKYYYRFGGSSAAYNPKFWIDQCQLYWLRKEYALEYEPDYVSGLTRFFIGILQDTIKLRLFIHRSKDRKEQTKKFLELFYSTKEYQEMVAADGQDEFLKLLRKKDTEGLLEYVERNTSRIGVMKTKGLALFAKYVMSL